MDISSLPDAHLRVFDRPELPDAIRSVYLIAICGTGMGSLAGLFKQAGYQVSGSDQNVYPPMSTRLEEEAITVYQGYTSDHIIPPPDLIIIGNACTPTHPEAAYAREQQLPQLSFPEALARFFLTDRKSLVVAGTHGKTTTTGLLIHLFKEADLDPGYLVGGVIQEENASYKLGSGPHFIVEGDEYDTAYFDKAPKFLHYVPHSAIVTSLELDHTDIYPDFDTYRSAFEAFAQLLPTDGTLVLCNDHPAVAALQTHTQARVILYGLKDAPAEGAHPYFTAQHVKKSEAGQTFELLENGVSHGELFLPLHGDHNLSNTLAACALALSEGISIERIRTGLARYQGMKRRQEVRALIDDILILDDFAHHPTAVKETIRAVRQGYPDRRLVAVFEPRSNSSRRKDFQDIYVEAFDIADEVILSKPPFRHNDSAENFMDIDALVADIKSKGVSAFAYAEVDGILQHLEHTARPGDAILIMSNGGFGGIHNKFLDSLHARVG